MFVVPNRSRVAHNKEEGTATVHCFWMRVFSRILLFFVFLYRGNARSSLPTHLLSAIQIKNLIGKLGLGRGGRGNLRGGRYLSLRLRDSGGGLDSSSASDGDLGEGLVLDEVGAEDGEHAAEDGVDHEKEEGKCRKGTSGIVVVVLGLLPKNGSEDEALVGHDEDYAEEETKGEGCLIPAHDESAAN